MDSVADKQQPAPPPLEDLRSTKLGRIPLERATAVAGSNDRSTSQPVPVHVTAFGSSL